MQQIQYGHKIRPETGPKKKKRCVQSVFEEFLVLKSTELLPGQKIYLQIYDQVFLAQTIFCCHMRGKNPILAPYLTFLYGPYYSFSPPPPLFLLVCYEGPCTASTNLPKPAANFFRASRAVHCAGAWPNSAVFSVASLSLLCLSFFFLYVIRAFHCLNDLTPPCCQLLHGHGCSLGSCLFINAYLFMLLIYLAR